MVTTRSSVRAEKRKRRSGGETSGVADGTVDAGGSNVRNEEAKGTRLKKVEKSGDKAQKDEREGNEADERDDEGDDDYINPEGAGVLGDFPPELITSILRKCDTNSLLAISELVVYLPVALVTMIL